MNPTAARFVPRKLQRKGTRNGGCGLAKQKASETPTKAPYLVGIAADLHAPQLEPVPVRIQLCGPEREQVTPINNRQACQTQKHALSSNCQISHFYPSRVWVAKGEEHLGNFFTPIGNRFELLKRAIKSVSASQVTQHSHLEGASLARLVERVGREAGRHDPQLSFRV